MVFGKLKLDDRIADCPYVTGIDLRPLLERYGQDSTWRTLLEKNRVELYAIHGFGEKTADKLYAFMSEHVEYSFADLIAGKTT